MNRVEQTRFFQLLQEHANHSEYVVFSGRLPIGCEPDTYREGCGHCLENDACWTRPAKLLRAGLAEAPYLIKPNLPEAEALLKRELKTLRSIRDAALELVGQSAQHVIISMWENSARFLGRTQVLVCACGCRGSLFYRRGGGCADRRCAVRPLSWETGGGSVASRRCGGLRKR